MTTYNGNAGVLDGLLKQGSDQVDRSFNAARNNIDRNRQKYGMQLTPEQQQANDISLSIGKSSALVDSQNRARLYQQDLNKQLVSGMGSSVGITK